MMPVTLPARTEYVLSICRKCRKCAQIYLNLVEKSATVIKYSAI